MPRLTASAASVRQGTVAIFAHPRAPRAQGPHAKMGTVPTDNRQANAGAAKVVSTSMDPFTLVAIVSAAAGVLLAPPIVWLVALRRTRSKKRAAFGVGDMVSIVVWSLVVLVGKLVIARQFGVHWFGLMHLLFLEMAIIVPWTGLLTLIAARWGLPWLGRLAFRRAALVVGWLSLTAVPLAVYARFIEPFWLQTETATLKCPGLADAERPITIGVLADLQFSEVTDHERRAISQMMALRPDIIVVPGDVFQGRRAAFKRNLAEIRSLLAALDAPHGVFLVDGDTDSPARIRQMIRGTKIRFLDNQIIEIPVRGRTIALAGIECDYDAGEPVECIRRLTREHRDADVRILLAHRPDAVLELTEADRVDLTIAGHTHGGQVCIPLFGPLVTETQVPRRAAAGGLSVVKGNRLYVSRGVGMERSVTQAPPIRFCCPPEISLLTLTGPAEPR